MTEYMPAAREAIVHYYPKLWEWVMLLLVVVELIAAGHLVQRKWTSKNEAVPVAVAVLLWIGLLAAYFLVAAALYKTTDDVRKYAILLWLWFFWIFPFAYATWSLVTSFAVRTVDGIGPFSASIEDPSKFAAARKLALRGDIDGAVSVYRSYPDGQANALFEAARLLKSEDRFVEAALLFGEIAERFEGQNVIWSEATYQLAKLQEINLGNPKGAQALYRDITRLTPDTRFGQLASADLARLQILDDDFLGELTAERADIAEEAAADDVEAADLASDEETEDDAWEVTAASDPFYNDARVRARRRHLAKQAEAKKTSGAKKQTASRKKPAARKSAARKSAAKKSAAKKPAAKKPAAKKPAAKKKSAAKKKPAAKKKSAARKPAATKKPASA